MNHRVKLMFHPYSPKTTHAILKTFSFAFVLAFCLIAAPPSSAQSETILYSTNPDENPASGVTMDKQGNLYGVTGSNGLTDKGEVFKLTPPAQPGGEWTPTMLHAFDGQPDGEYPSGNLLLDSAGNLYGTTAGGGSRSGGTVYEITAAGVERILYNFKIGTDDARSPAGGLVRDSQGNFYGLTTLGGTANQGAVYKLTPSGKETVLYNFQGGSDGYTPVGALTLDSHNNLYGATWKGGPNHAGTIFKLTPTGVKTIFHGFAANSTDGQYPYAGPVMDAKGNLYGTTGYGGANSYGTVFALTASGTEKILYSFKGGEFDGQLPEASLILDTSGNLYGTTSLNPNAIGPFGTVFEVTPAGKEIILHKFTNSPDGYDSAASLIMDSQANLYGTTTEGGATGAGTVFEVTP